MKRILFVCYGNVMRSQMAQGYYNFWTRSQAAVSAGVNPTTHLKFQNPHPQAIQVMQEEGIDIARQPCRFIQPEMVTHSDSIFVFVKPENCPDYLRDSLKTSFWLVEDPFDMPLDEVRRIRDMVKAHVQAILPYH